MSSKINKILVPIDFSEQSLIALSQSYNLAAKIKAEIILLYVIEELAPAVKMFYAGLDEIAEAVENNLKHLAEDKEKLTGLKFSTIVARGKVYNKIVKIASSKNVSLIIMGAKGVVKSKFVGSNSLRVVKTAPCPVITVKGKAHKKGCDRILLPLDLTKETSDKVTEAIQMAKIFNSEIYILSVLLVDKNEVKSRIEKQLNNVKNKIEKEKVKCVPKIINIKKGEESLVGAVLRYAQKNEIDLIMIMTQQESNFKELFIGSRARAIINLSNTPVLSIIPN